jgi:outer membrane protein OmpA-like peptidoglycan-associated protein
MQVKGSAFDKGLYDGYLALAKAEYDETDWKDGGAFSDRAVASAKGSAPGPEAISARKLPKRSVSELSSARSKLVSALGKGAANKVPADAAKAQVMFDCWMQEQEEDIQPDDIAKCRAQFMAAMSKVEAALKPAMVAKPMAKPKPKKKKARRRTPQTTRYMVYFDFNSARLDKNARSAIDIIKSDAKQKGAKVSLAGFTDRAGASDYNNILATKRAKVVFSALIKAGVKSKIGTAAYGEERNAVPTKDGVAEVLNRRVEVLITR